MDFQGEIAQLFFLPKETLRKESDNNFSIFT